ncbi:MAG TPA: hypothetical protein VM165_09030 [Planctomycetaceae bacterium]|nr:hypothetical protein [Planctomycetaceae bacterium]
MVGRIAAAVLLCAVVIAAGLTVSAQPAPDASGELMVVMTDGRVLRGSVMRHATGYFVERPSGRILVPHEQIRCVAKNLPDAYRQQREAMIDPTAASLIRLAEWCISYNLYDEAADELRRTLRRDPENETARKMLARVQDQLLAEPAKALEKPYVNRDGVISADVESLGGLSKETAATFTTRIQPLLMNKCGNAGCHGVETDNGFRLTPVRFSSPNHRRSAEMNLALVMKLIDTQEPHRSPLLETIRKGHGGAPATLFGGSQGTAQLRTLTDWVQTVAAERVAEEERLAKRTPLKKNSKTPTTSETASVPPKSLSPEPTIQQVSFTTESGPAPHLLASGTRPGDEPKLLAKPGELAPKRRVDRFDPQAFNERFGNAAKSK